MQKRRAKTADTSRSRRSTISNSATGRSGRFADARPCHGGAAYRDNTRHQGFALHHGAGEPGVGDGLAGVVNIVLRRDFAGFEASARYGEFGEFYIPRIRLDVVKQRARGIGRIRHMRLAARQLPDQEGIDGAGEQFASFRAFPCSVDIIEHPGELRA